MQEVYRVRAEGETEEGFEGRALYNRKNRFIEGTSLVELVLRVEDEAERKRLEGEIAKIKAKYHALSETYQEGKKKGLATASVWQ